MADRGRPGLQAEGPASSGTRPSCRRQRPSYLTWIRSTWHNYEPAGMPRTTPPPPVTSLPVTAIRVNRRRPPEVPRRCEPSPAPLRTWAFCTHVAVTPEFQLVAGERRARAVRDILGWESVPVHVVHGLDDALRLLQAERDENTQRLPFTPTEAVALGRQLERLELAAARQRQRGGGRRGGADLRAVGGRRAGSKPTGLVKVFPSLSGWAG